MTVCICQNSQNYTRKRAILTVFKSCINFFLMEGKKESQMKISPRESRNSSLGSYENDVVIIWKSYIT